MIGRNRNISAKFNYRRSMYGVLRLVTYIIRKIFANKRFIFFILIAVLFTSCSIFKKSTKKKTNTTKPNTEVVAPKHTDKKPVEKKKQPYKTCSFKIKTNFKGMPVTITARTQYDSVFWFSASSIGMEAMRVLCTTDSVFMIDKLNKENVHWTYTRASVYTGLPLSFSFIQDLFCDTTLVKSYTTAKFSGTVVKKNQTIQGVTVPEQVYIDGTIKGKKQKISLRMSAYKFNENVVFPFDFPKGYKYVK